jgi:hypothetical protein
LALLSSRLLDLPQEHQQQQQTATRLSGLLDLLQEHRRQRQSAMGSILEQALARRRELARHLASLQPPPSWWHLRQERARQQAFCGQLRLRLDQRRELV